LGWASSPSHLDLRHLPGETNPFQAANEKVEGVFVLCKDDDFFILELRITQNLAKLDEFRLVSLLVNLLRQVEKFPDLGLLKLQFRE
jgi:hypothetical protein